MGCNRWYVTASLAQWAYMFELRTSKSVHATLRTVMQKIAKEIERVLEINPRYDNTASSPYGPVDCKLLQRQKNA